MEVVPAATLQGELEGKGVPGLVAANATNADSRQPRGDGVMPALLAASTYCPKNAWSLRDGVGHYVNCDMGEVLNGNGRERSDCTSSVQ